MSIPKRLAWICKENYKLFFGGGRGNPPHLIICSCVIKSEMFPLKILILLSSINGYHLLQILLS